MPCPYQQQSTRPDSKQMDRAALSPEHTEGQEAELAQLRSSLHARRQPGGGGAPYSSGRPPLCALYLTTKKPRNRFPVDCTRAIPRSVSLRFMDSVGSCPG